VFLILLVLLVLWQAGGAVADLETEKAVPKKPSVEVRRVNWGDVYRT